MGVTAAKDDVPRAGKDGRDKGRRGFMRELPIVAGLALIIAFLVRTFVVQPFYIPSGSMEHTLDVQDHVLASKISYRVHPPHRGDIVVFDPPQQWINETGDGGEWIKRVIAVGGDHVRCCTSHDQLVVNGKALDEPYIYRSTDGKQDPPSEAPFKVTVPNGRLWLMGDHRSDSADSREHYLRTHNVVLSTEPVDKVVGRAVAVYWPPSRIAWLSRPATFADVPNP